MEIINSHIHLGTSHILDSNYTEEQLLADMKRNGLSGMMVYPLVEPQPDNIEGHNRIHRFAQAHPGQVWGVVDMHPRHLEEDYCREVRRCVRDLGFVAIKLHPYLHGVNPNNSCTTKCFDMARELSVPIIIHTGLGIPFSLPALVTRRARQIPTLKSSSRMPAARCFRRKPFLSPKCLRISIWSPPGVRRTASRNSAARWARRE